MPAQVPLYQEVLQRISAWAQGPGVRVTTLGRLALLVTGIRASDSTSLAAMARQLHALALTGAICQESIERRLCRALSDSRLTLETCYLPVLGQVIAWSAILEDSQWVVLLVDEKERPGPPLPGESPLPGYQPAPGLGGLATEPALARRTVLGQVDEVLAQVASRLPQGVQVLVLADRAYHNPPFVDRLAAYGWHFVIRCKAKSSLHSWPQWGREGPLSQWLARHLPGSGPRAGCRRRRAGGRPAWWRCGPLEKKNPWWSSATCLPAGKSWPGTVGGFGLRLGSARTSPGVGRGRPVECVGSSISSPRRLVAMAWASLVALCLGDQEAQGRQARRQSRRWLARPRPPKPQPAKERIFTMGLRWVKRWLYCTTEQPMRWVLWALQAPSWNSPWYHHQALFYIFRSVRL